MIYIMPQSFYLFIIHTQKLVARQPRLHGLIQDIRVTAQACGCNFKSIMVLNPDPNQLDQKQLNDRINYDTSGFQEFDKMRAMLNMEQLSNYEKHRAAWKKIRDLSKESKDDIYMVIEDDAFMLPDAKATLQELIQTMVSSTQPSTWDLMLLSLSDKSADMNQPISFHNFRETGTILPSKESYFIKPTIANSFLSESETIRFPMRTQMSYIIHKNPLINVVYPNKRLMLDGSKLGLYPSSINPNNMLVYNQEYMELWSYMRLNSEEIPVSTIRATYKKVAHIQNPDIMHLYGVLLFKAGEVIEAQDILTDAIQLLQKQNGLVTNQSDLLNNLINMYEASQTDVTEAMSKPSKYAVSKKTA